MSQWNKTYRLRQEQTAREINVMISQINDKLLTMPAEYRLSINDAGRELKLVGPQKG